MEDLSQVVNALGGVCVPGCFRPSGFSAIGWLMITTLSDAIPYSHLYSPPPPSPGPGSPPPPHPRLGCASYPFRFRDRSSGVSLPNTPLVPPGSPLPPPHTQTHWHTHGGPPAHPGVLSVLCTTGAVMPMPS
jgi:hypothetical protein